MHMFVLIVGSMEKSHAYICSSCGLYEAVICIGLFYLWARWRSCMHMFVLVVGSM